MITVTLYEREQIYGGPEEGGWWTHRDNVEQRLQFRSHRAAKKWMRKRHTKAVREWNKRNGYRRFGDRCPDLIIADSGKVLGAWIQHRKHGQGDWIAIERTPGNMAHPTITHYE